MSDPLAKDIEQTKDKLREDCSVTGDKEPVPVAENPKPKNTVSLPYVPKSSIEFMSHWKSLRGNQELLVKYFQARIVERIGTSTVEPAIPDTRNAYPCINQPLILSPNLFLQKKCTCVISITRPLSLDYAGSPVHVQEGLYD